MFLIDEIWKVCLKIFTEEHIQCCCPRGKSLSLRILEDQFTSLVLDLVLGPQSPRKLSRTSHSANSLL